MPRPPSATAEAELWTVITNAAELYDYVGSLRDLGQVTAYLEAERHADSAQLQRNLDHPLSVTLRRSE